MRKGGGKAKGASFEREVCKKLSLWVSNGKHEDVFWRSAMSGGRSTIAAAKGKRLAAQAGDISCIHPIGEVFAHTFFMECKNYADLSVFGLISNTGNLLKFWNTAKEESNKYSKYPMLIAKENRQPTILCLNTEGCEYLGIKNLALLEAPPHDLFIFNFEGVLANVPANR